MLATPILNRRVAMNVAAQRCSTVMRCDSNVLSPCVAPEMRGNRTTETRQALYTIFERTILTFINLLLPQTIDARDHRHVKSSAEDSSLLSTRSNKNVSSNVRNHPRAELRSTESSHQNSRDKHGEIWIFGFFQAPPLKVEY